MLVNRKIGFIGAGNMAEALIAGLLHANRLSPSQLMASDIDGARLTRLHETYKIEMAGSNRDVAERADILVLAGPIWLGDNSSVMKRVHERLYGGSHLLNDAGQYLYYGRVGGCLITGNEDGVKHCAQNVLYTLQHIGYTIPPQADAGWIGEAGPGPSYLDPGSGGPENDFTNRNTTFMTWNLMHLAALLKKAGGVPAHGNQRSAWDAGCRFDFENPEYR